MKITTKMKNVTKIAISFLSVAALVGAILVSTMPALAANTCNPNIHNNLIFNRDASNTEIVDFQIANPGTTGVIAPGGLPGSTIAVPASGELDLSVSQIYESMQSFGAPAPSFLFAATAWSPTDYMTIRYNDAATYDGQPVDIIVTYHNIVDAPNGAFGPVPADIRSFEINHRLFAGQFFWGLSQFEASYQIVESGATTPIGSFTSSYLSIGSLNEFEYTAPGNNTTVSAYGSVITQQTVGAQTVYMGEDANGTNWVDMLGDPTYGNAAVLYQLGGSQFSYFIGLTGDVGGLDFIMWTTPSTAMIPDPVCAPAPTKSVDKSSVDLDSTGSLTYQVTQRTQEVGTEIFSRYGSFVMTDVLDSRLSVNPTNVVIMVGGVDRTSSFTVGYNATTYTLTATASSSLLDDDDFYGVNLVMTVPTTYTASSADSFLNQAAVNIDSHISTSNEVETTVNVPGTPQLEIVKSIDKTLLEIGEDATYTVTVRNVDEPGVEPTSGTWTITDDVPDNFAISDQLPTGCDSGSVVGQRVVCETDMVLEPGDSVTLTIPVVAIAAGEGIINTASVFGGGDPTCLVEGDCVANAPAVIIEDRVPEIPEIPGIPEVPGSPGAPATGVLSIVKPSSKSPMVVLAVGMGGAVAFFLTSSRRSARQKS